MSDISSHYDDGSNVVKPEDMALGNDSVNYEHPFTDQTPVSEVHDEPFVSQVPHSTPSATDIINPPPKRTKAEQIAMGQATRLRKAIEKDPDYESKRDAKRNEEKRVKELKIAHKDANVEYLKAQQELDALDPAERNTIKGANIEKKAGKLRDEMINLKANEKQVGSASDWNTFKNTLINKEVKLTKEEATKLNKYASIVPNAYSKFRSTSTVVAYKKAIADIDKHHAKIKQDDIRKASPQKVFGAKAHTIHDNQVVDTHNDINHEILKNKL